MSKIDYAKILSGERLRSSTYENRTLLTESESDRGRVLFSPAFRRLQQKAQVFSMEPNAAVRSRLTHSLEVSQIGRYLADEIGEKLVDAKLIDAGQQGAFVNFVETACLMHDIGNPPFGHFGEAAIQDWFRKNGIGCFEASTKYKQHKKAKDIQETERQALEDFYQFDGNPQGLRVVARLQRNNDEYGLNLTKTSLGSFLKYVRSPLDQPSGLFTKKAGYFTTEQDIVKRIWDEFGYDSPQRFPLAYIMEAADDIAYCISDLEDSFEKEIVPEEIALPELCRMYEAKDFDEDSPCHDKIQNALTSLADKNKNGETGFTYIDFRTRLNRVIVKYAASRFFNNQDKIASGKLDALLPESEPPGAVLGVLKAYCKQHVYTHDSVQRLELAGFNAISGLLDRFRPLLEASRERFNAVLQGEREYPQGERILLEPKLLKLFPPKYLKVYEHHVQQSKLADLNVVEWNARAHLIVDFVSGMTDDFAMTTYRTLAGMRL